MTRLPGAGAADVARVGAGSAWSRIAFVLVVVTAAAWGLRGREDEVWRAASGVDPGEWALALGLVAVGLAATCRVWGALLRAHGHELGWREEARVFFAGQLGKYVPGSVWSIAVQARMAAASRVPLRTTAATSLVFLLVHLASVSLVVLPALPFLDLATHVLVVAGVGSVLALVLLYAPVLARVARRLAGADALVEGRGLAAAVGWMACAWACYCLALAPLLPELSTRAWVHASAAFALAYAVGVLVPFAPAGLGAREVMFVLTLGPVVGVSAATAVALLARVVHTVCDFALAGAAWALRSRRGPEDEPRHAGT